MKIESETDYTEPNATAQEVSYIDTTKMQQSLSHYKMNPLYIYISGIFGKEESNRLFDLYHVGTSKKWGGSTVFWQVDNNGNIRTGKIMRYDPTTGHRVKIPHSYVCWVHTELQLKGFRLKQCLFGEHLLSTFSQREVVLVESEKTAIIAAHFIPDYIWLATGGMNGCFNSDALEVLRDRSVMLIPDLGATDNWKKKVPLLKTICRKVNLNKLLESITNDEQRSKGFDIADFLLLGDSKQQILQKMLHKNQSLQLLIDTFGLELVDTGHLS